MKHLKLYEEFYNKNSRKGLNSKSFDLYLKIKKWFDELPITSEFPVDLDLTLSINEKKDGLIFFFNSSSSKTTEINPNVSVLTPFPEKKLTFKHEEIKPVTLPSIEKTASQNNKPAADEFIKEGGSLFSINKKAL